MREEDGQVSVFQYQPNPNLFVHIFEEANAEWLHFAACNRNLELFPDLRRKYATVDIIGGKVADDQTAITLNNYVAGTYGVPGTERADRTTMELLEPERLKDQFCFRTNDAIHSLQFLGVSDMEASVNTVTIERKEATAITVMRCMLVTFSKEKHIPFEQALLNFSQSRTYEDLFDFDTEIWKEGPDYLRCLYDEECSKSA